MESWTTWLGRAPSLPLYQLSYCIVLHNAAAATLYSLLVFCHRVFIGLLHVFVLEMATWGRVRAHSVRPTCRHLALYKSTSPLPTEKLIQEKMIQEKRTTLHTRCNHAANTL